MVRSQRLKVLSEGHELHAVFGSYQLGKRTVTTCELAYQEGSEFLPLGSGASICAPGDRCSQAIGEKKALAMAMEGWTRASREQAQKQLELFHLQQQIRPHLAIPRIEEEAGYGAGV